MFAVIDLGSNSFHLLIANYIDGHFTVVDRHSERVQLAEKLLSTGRLQTQAMERGLQCLRNFRDVIAQYPIEKLSAVATQALRQANNTADFLAGAKTLGFDIEVISGQREAALIYRGICDPLSDTDFNRLVIDIGGASTEIALGCGQTVLVAESFPIGCVSWRDQFFSNPLNYAAQAPAAIDEASQILQPLTDKLTDHNWAEVYASSGSAKMLTNISIANNFSDGTLSPKCLEKIAELLQPLHDTNNLTIEGLKPERYDLLAPGLAIISSIMQCLTIDKVEYSHTALREGILHEISSHRVDYHLHL